MLVAGVKKGRMRCRPPPLEFDKKMQIVVALLPFALFWVALLMCRKIGKFTNAT